MGLKQVSFVVERGKERGKERGREEGGRDVTLFLATAAVIPPAISHTTSSPRDMAYCTIH